MVLSGPQPLFKCFLFSPVTTVSVLSHWAAVKKNKDGKKLANDLLLVWDVDDETSAAAHLPPPPLNLADRSLRPHCAISFFFFLLAEWLTHNFNALHGRR